MPTEPRCASKRSFCFARLVPDLLSEDLTLSLYQNPGAALQPPTLRRAEQTIQSVLLNVEESAQLRVAAYSAAFLVERTTYDQHDRPISAPLRCTEATGTVTRSKSVLQYSRGHDIILVT